MKKKENSDVDDDDDDNELGEVIDILHGTMNKRLDPKTRNRYNKILTKFFNWVKGITKLRHRCLREDDSFILPLPVEIQFLKYFFRQLLIKYTNTYLGGCDAIIHDSTQIPFCGQ